MMENSNKIVSDMLISKQLIEFYKKFRPKTLTVFLIMKLTELVLDFSIHSVINWRFDSQTFRISHHYSSGYLLTGICGSKRNKRYDSTSLSTGSRSFIYKYCTE
jgi:hypothetical protein